MEGGERKEEGSLPANYVSLAQLQERWLRKQQEKKLKEKHEEEDKRERAALAQNQNNQNRNERGPTKAADGFVRATGKGVVQDKGKGKEIVGGGGPANVNANANGGEINKKRSKSKKKKRKHQERATAVEAEVLGGGGAAILSRSGGGVEEIVNVFAVEVLPVSGGEIAHVNQTGFRKNKGSRRANESKQGEMALDLEKKKEEEGENGHGMKWRERGRETGGESGGGRDRGRNGGRVNELKQTEMALELEKEKEEGKNDRGMKWRERRRNGGYPESRINRKEYRPVVLTDNGVDSKLENKAEDGISEVCSEISSLKVGDKIGIRGRDNKAKEDGGVEGQSLNGDKVAVESEKKVHEVLASKSGYRTNGNPRGGFGRGHRTNGKPWGCYGRDGRYTRPQISDRMNSTESVKVWVKKEDKLDA